MSSENDRLLALIGKGDTLQALNVVYTGEGGGSRLALNRALYGPAGEDHDAALFRSLGLAALDPV